MSSKVLDRVRKLSASRPRGGGGPRLRGIYHKWADGDNTIRLAGDFLRVETMFIAPSPKRNERGLCRPDAFQGEGRIPMVINCLDWDIAKEEWRKDRVCPIRKLNAIAKALLDSGESTEKEKEFFKKLMGDTRNRTNIKYNLLDRADPYITSVSDDKEERVLGFKIATFGMEAWADVEGIFSSMEADIGDPEDGIDIIVTKGSNGVRVAYSAKTVLDTSVKPPTVKVTPFTAEERALQLHDLNLFCGKMVEPQQIIDALHEDLRELYDAYEDDVEEESSSVGSDAEAAALKEALSEGDDDGLIPEAGVGSGN